LRARLTLVDRADPDEHAVGREQISLHLVGEALVVYDRTGVDAGLRERLENAERSLRGLGETRSWC
jgi:hypothetical protein